MDESHTMYTILRIGLRLPGSAYSNLIIALVGLEESRGKNLKEWKASINEAKEMCDLSQLLEDPDSDLRYPLLHWAATLGKFKAVKWLLEQ